MFEDIEIVSGMDCHLYDDTSCGIKLAFQVYIKARISSVKTYVYGKNAFDVKSKDGI